MVTVVKVIVILLEVRQRIHQVMTVSNAGNSVLGKEIVAINALIFALNVKINIKTA